ncbi:MAG: hypothetical protein WA324_04545, partial [Bryobacteraceae bacterium]
MPGHANNPYGFVAALVAGATVAFVLFHLSPAILGRDVSARQCGKTRRPLVRYLVWIVRGWLSIGAAVSAILLARFMGDLPYLWWPDSGCWPAVVST